MLSACDDAPKRREENPFQRANKIQLENKEEVTRIVPEYDYDEWWDSFGLVEQRLIRQGWRDMAPQERPKWVVFRNKVIHRWLQNRPGGPPPTDEYEIADGDMPWVMEEILEALYLGDELLSGEPQDGGVGYGPMARRMESGSPTPVAGEAAITRGSGSALPNAAVNSDSGIDMEEWGIEENPKDSGGLNRHIEEGLY